MDITNARIHPNPSSLFECFCEVIGPSGDQPAWLLLKYPDEYGDEVRRKRIFYDHVFFFDDDDCFFKTSIEFIQREMKSIPKFCFPTKVDSSAVQLFTFTLTEGSGRLRFGFCRHSTDGSTCVCLIR